MKKKEKKTEQQEDKLSYIYTSFFYAEIPKGRTLNPIELN
jgi:hypothetical protein